MPFFVESAGSSAGRRLHPPLSALLEQAALVSYAMASGVSTPSPSNVAASKSALPFAREAAGLTQVFG